MKSHAHQSISNKRFKKLAAQLTDEEIRASLHQDQDNRVYIDERGEPVVACWNAFSGPLALMNDDPVLEYAQLGFLRRHGYPSFKSDREIREYAEQNGWPRKAITDA